MPEPLLRLAAAPAPSTQTCRHRPVQRAAAADAHAPPVWLPLQFIVTGVASLLAGCIWLVLKPDLLATYHYNQYIIAATHLFVLGWIGSVIMGALYQLVPVALETRLHNVRLARWHFGLHVVGFVGMVAMFHVWNMKQVGHFGSALALGAGFFVYNLGRTLRRIPRWNVVAAGIASALAWLSLTLLAGLYLSAAKCWDFSPFAPLAQMHAHAHLGGLGFFLLLLVAVSYRMVPMFTLGAIQSPRRAAWSLILLNAGLAVTATAILLSSPWKLGGALILVAGFGVYGWEIAAIVRARQRRGLDWAMRYFLTALALLVPTAALGILLAWPDLPQTQFTTQLENVYGLLAFLGVLTLAILGMLYKIVPFLTWYACYSRNIGLGPVPALSDLYSRPLQAAGYGLFLTGLLVTSVATALGHEPAVRAGTAGLLAAVMVFAVNLGLILRHFFHRPQAARGATAPGQAVAPRAGG